MMNTIKQLIFSLCLLPFMAFAQGASENPSVPPKLAVYVFGSGSAGVDKSLGGKLLTALVQSGEYSELKDHDAFQGELSRVHQGGSGQIAHSARQYGADFVCAVSLTEVFGSYSISARLMKTSDSSVVRSAQLDRSLKSLEDVSGASDELASQLSARPQAPYQFSVPPSASAPVVSAAPPAAAVAPVAAAPPPAVKQCASRFNINELASKVGGSFPSLLKDCSSKLAKDMLLAASPFGKKGAAPEPKSFMKSCAVDGIRNAVPSGFPAADKFTAVIDNFTQNLLNSASSGGSVDPKKLAGAVGSMDIGALLGDIRKLASSNDCIVDEPYESPVASPVAAEAYDDDDDYGDEGDSGEKRTVYFGLRGGFNTSHLRAIDNSYNGYSGSYNGSAFGQGGFLLDIVVASWFRLQPGLMFIGKGARDDDGNEAAVTYLEFPLLLSLKLSALRLNAGPYFALPSGSSDIIDDRQADFGISLGFGFDIWKLYLGMFYDIGLTNVSRVSNMELYNRTLGFNFGVNI